MALLKRIEKIEEATGGRGGCPTCWAMPVDWTLTRLIVQGDAEAQIPTCPQCGRRPEMVLIRRYGADVEAV